LINQSIKQLSLSPFPPLAQVPTHDGLIRIQNEISEVEKREIELRKEHASSRTNSVNGDSISSSSPEPIIVSPVTVIDSKDHFKKNKIIEPRAPPPFVLTRALSTPQLFQVSPMKKFNISSPHKGIMQKFIASHGKMIGNQQYASTQNNFKKNLMMVRSRLLSLGKLFYATFPSSLTCFAVPNRVQSRQHEGVRQH
jgi:hypothetical protein